MNREPHTIRTEQQAILDALTAAGATVKRPNAIRCPFHEDNHPSASIHRSDDGIWRFKCHACGWYGDIFDVRAKAEGRPVEELLKEAAASRLPIKVDRMPAGCDAITSPPPKIFATLAAVKASYGDRLQAVYEYTDPKRGHVDLAIVRFSTGKGKACVPYIPHAGGWISAGHPPPRPLYNRGRLADPSTQADAVMVVEGEKCVHLLHDVGIVATTSPGGSKAADKADWTPLAGRLVVIWPDADKGGIEYGKTVARILSAMTPPANVRWVDPGGLGLGEKDDVEQFLARHKTPHTQRCAVYDVMRSAVSLGGASGLQRRLDRIKAGQWASIDWPWSIVGEQTRALLPGTVTLLCGSPEAGKTFLALQCLEYWYGQQVPVAFYMLEEDREYHLARILAQIEGEAGLCDDKWIRANPEGAQDAMDLHRPFLDGVSKLIVDAPTNQPSLENLAEWVEAASVSHDILVIDPITIATVSGKQWEADKSFMGRVKVAIRDTDTRLILVTHPRIGQAGKPGLDGVAGGSAYVRFAQTVMWLRKHNPWKTFTIKKPMGVITEDANRSLLVCKARNAHGGGSNVAMHFDRQSLKFRALGVEEKR